MSASMLRFRLQVWRGRKAAAQEVIDSRDSTVSDAVQAIKDKKNAERRIKELEAWI
jgi:hypothetical protein